jgi:hypothetical protein
MSSDRWAWLHTNGASGFHPKTHPSDDTTWSTAGSCGAASWVHLDDDGFSTSTQVLTGKKYWVIFYRDPSLPDNDRRGDLGAISWLPNHEEYMSHKFGGWLTAEAIEMVPGTLL